MFECIRMYQHINRTHFVQASWLMFIQPVTCPNMPAYMCTLFDLHVCLCVCVNGGYSVRSVWIKFLLGVFLSLSSKWAAHTSVPKVPEIRVNICGRHVQLSVYQTLIILNLFHQCFYSMRVTAWMTAWERECPCVAASVCASGCACQGLNAAATTTTTTRDYIPS